MDTSGKPSGQDEVTCVSANTAKLLYRGTSSTSVTGLCKRVGKPPAFEYRFATRASSDGGNIQIGLRESTRT